MYENIKNHIESKIKIILFISVLSYIVIFSILAFLKFSNFRYNALDLGIINQVFYNSVHGKFFESTIHPSTYLKDHFSPILFLFLPLYILFQSPLLLIIIQISAIAVCSIPIYLIAKNYFSKIPSFLVALAWLLNPAVQNLSLFEFSFLSLALPCIFFALYYYTKNRMGTLLMFSCVALLVREDVSLFIFMLGLLMIFDKKNIRWGIATLIISSFYFIISMKIIALLGGNGGYKFFVYYSWLGKDWLEVIKNILLHPIIWIKRFWSIGNIEMILGFLLPFSFLPIFGTRYLLLSSLIYAQIFFGAPGPSGLILKTQYSTLFLPSLFMSYIFGMYHLKTSKKNSFFQKYFVKDFLGKIIIITAVIYSMFTLGPIIGTIEKNVIRKNKATNIRQHSLLKIIPPHSSVVSSYKFLPHVSSREFIYGFNYFFIGKEQFGIKDFIIPETTQYLLMDSSDFISYELQYRDNEFYKDSFSSGDDRVRNFLQENNFGILDIIEDDVVWKRDFSSQKSLYTVLKTLPSISNTINSTLGETLTFIGYNKKNSDNDFLYLELFWKAEKDIEKNYFFNFILEDSDKKILYEKIHAPAYGIFPTSEWKKGDIVQTNYYLPDDILNSKNTSLSMQLFEIEKGAIFIDSDLATKNIVAEKKSLGDPTILSLDPQQ